VHIYSPCPTGWRSAPEHAITVAKQAVNSKVFPLYEVIDGQFILTRDIKKPIPVPSTWLVSAASAT
jgi:pyruvate ferredoxin oxidoreductase beta subunit